MALVETDMFLYIISNKAYDYPSEFMQVFKAQVDKINAHGVRYRYNPELCK